MCFGEHFLLILVPFAVPVTIIAEALREIFCSIEDSARSRISYARFLRVVLFWSVFGCSFETSDVGPYPSTFIFNALFVFCEGFVNENHASAVVVRHVLLEF